MELMNTLLPKLRTLRLSGILQTLDLRNRQAIEEQCTYVDFLARLLEDEVERRGCRQLQLRLKRSGLPSGRSLESFDFTFNPAINRQQIYDLAAGSYIDKAESVFLIGPAGVGKTHLAQALGHEAVRQGREVLYVSAGRMLAHIHGGRADGTHERRLQQYLRPDVLIVDDFGLKPMRPPASEDLYEIIDGRYGRSPLILTTNRAFGEWLELFDQPILAAAALDRLAHGARHLVITGDSYRSRGGRAPGDGLPPRRPLRSRR